MRMTYYPFKPFEINEGKLTVIETNNHEFYQTLILNFKDLQDDVHFSDDEFKRLKAKLIHFYNKYNNSIRVTAIFDKAMISPYKASPIDQGPQVFEKLLAERIIPKG